MTKPRNEGRYLAEQGDVPQFVFGNGLWGTKPMTAKQALRVSGNPTIYRLVVEPRERLSTGSRSSRRR